MRLRVLLTNGARTVDLIWLRHTGRDVYYGNTGWEGKTSYHASGRRHFKTNSGGRHEIQQHHRLDSFKGQIQLCAFGFSPQLAVAGELTEYAQKKGDSVIWLDSRTLPKEINVFLGLLEVGGYDSILPVHKFSDLRLVHLVTNTAPWIYVMVLGTRKIALNMPPQPTNAAGV